MGLDRRVLARQLLGLNDAGRERASEAQLKMASHIAEAILRDLVTQARKIWREEGPGILVIRRFQDDAIWSDRSDIADQIEMAEDVSDTDLARIFRSILQRVEAANPERAILIAVADARGLRVLELPVEDPAESTRRFIQAWND